MVVGFGKAEGQRQVSLISDCGSLISGSEKVEDRRQETEILDYGVIE